MSVKLHGHIIVALLLLWGVAYSQPKAVVTHYGAEDGLSHVAVNHMIQDQQGFMWFATWNGINRFDGHRFIPYKSMPGDNSPLKNDRVDALVDGDQDHLWLKAYDNQIYAFNKATGTLQCLNDALSQSDKPKTTFKRILAATNQQLWLESTDRGMFYFPDVYQHPSKYIRFYSGAGEGRAISSNKINFFHIDNDQCVWLGTDKGLSYLRKRGNNNFLSVNLIKHDALTDIAEGDRLMYLVSGSGNLYITNKHTGRTSIKKVTDHKLNNALISKRRNVIYMSGALGKLFECDLQDFTMREVAHAAGKMGKLFEDSKGNVWIEPEATGALRYSPFKGAITAYNQQLDANARFTGNHYRVFEDTNGQVWVSLRNGGFGYYDAVNDKIAYFHNDPNDENRKFSNNVVNWHYDPSGVLWLTTNEHGLEKIVFQQNDFHHQQLEAPGRFKSENDVRGMAIDRKGRVWVGTKGKKLYWLQNGQQITPKFINAPPNGLGQVYAITPDSSGNIWLGTKRDGLFKAEPVDALETAYRLQHYQHEPGNANSLNNDEIYTILQDKRGRIWVGSFVEGLNLLVANGSSVRFVHQAELLKGLPQWGYKKIRKMALDASGNIWVATTDGLLIIRDQADQMPFAAKTFNKIPGNIASLGSNDVQYIYKDRNNIMWLGTSGGGISKALGTDPHKGLSFQNFATREGLFNDYIVSLTGDKNGNLWIASQTGLTRFNPLSGEFRNYNSTDGLTRTVFSEAACVNMPGGTIVFGTMDGLISFNPQELVDNLIPGRMVFTDLQVNNQDLAQLKNPALLTHQINELSLLQLQHNHNTISFDYTVLDYRSDNKQNYLYRLQGFDSVWHSNRGLQRTTYTNLPPGKYKFEIKSVSTGLYTNNPYKSINITILPPLWQTWWAYLLYFILALIIFEAIRRTVLTMLRLRHRIAVEQNIASLKTTFFTNISHELRTPLTLIINPITAIADTENLSDNGKEYIAIVQKNANRMVRFINQLLDLRKVQSGKATLNYQPLELLEFIKDISLYFVEIAREKNISIAINANTKRIDCRLDPEKMDIVFFNILANAYKFSPAGKHISIDVNLSGAAVTILIADEGGGVPPDNLDSLFKLFYEGDHQQQKGTGIGLALTKEMVELHEGRIWAVNNNKGGLTVGIELLVNNQFKTSPGNSYPARVIDNSSSANAERQEEKPDLQELVLIVEDNSDLRTFLRAEVSKNYRVETADNGLNGLDMARRLLPEIILSDIMMPEMDGIAMLYQLKHDENTSHIPVILLSAKNAVESQVEGLQYGADAYITKPFNNNFLMATINRIVTGRRAIFRAMGNDKPMVEISPSPIVITSNDELFLQKVIKIVEEGMADPDFTIENVAGLMNMSRSPFYKKLKSLTHLAPVELIREMRLKRAKQYMDAGETVLNDIAFKVGFSNVKYFSSCFKDQYQKSPSEYLKEIRIKA